MTKGFRLIASTGIHQGDREYQQDQVALISHERHNGCVLGVIADGMGGRSGGRHASDQIVFTAQQLFERYSPDADDAAALLRNMVEETHLVIRLIAISAEQKPHSTIAAFLINPRGDCHWVHAGDSRIYHFRGDQLVFRTSDHSYVQALVDRGELTEEQAQRHPQSNILLGCLGAERDPPVTAHAIAQLQPGDALLACSDGLWNYFTQAELASVVDGLPPRKATEVLVEEARVRACGKGDNLSLVIVKIAALAQEEPLAHPAAMGTGPP
ncbi:PP2C family protein-serine/threonine phosphatase [Verminephrobacter aporrectodeae]|uniref:Serine/threonine-protein phosphatase n=1 Tax=Verminephrobacter aporrectodeae subsp. tuberculatae TaxID=1110392 RepID=A0ABT3KUZ2_9BURK|nr:protein phosphatase 2C domain-containing protein [Verminephrobacter aporrectodeae]MCW5223106.1 serine/threonine-protein phosphatase [Verminephrobacter aporrectodeae subsp. tuberculatae]MCW5288570.1 serine/threonine-protein phosphatase [Verminephrobacter aporrectodeae subsp. tuberculatae]MCW5322158.1 serine/threonine-protein phosphatase [Verminephrobacter aporrectodeae subsp. tuberculatae]MCW8164515.1 serine/threonine-protein phosphatase [Verminephrobacter aporrectodeae subsp. tuberculatae]M